MTTGFRIIQLGDIYVIDRRGINLKAEMIVSDVEKAVKFAGACGITPNVLEKYKKLVDNYTKTHDADLVLDDMKYIYSRLPSFAIDECLNYAGKVYKDLFVSIKKEAQYVIDRMVELGHDFPYIDQKIKKEFRGRDIFRSADWELVGQTY